MWPTGPQPARLMKLNAVSQAGFQKCLPKTAIQKISAHPDLATQFFQIRIPTTFNSLSYQKGNSHFSHV